MEESEVIRRSIEALKELVSDLEHGLQPSHGVLWELVSRQMAYEIARESR